jgi:hypothetical protein
LVLVWEEEENPGWIEGSGMRNPLHLQKNRKRHLKTNGKNIASPDLLTNSYPYCFNSNYSKVSLQQFILNN